MATPQHHVICPNCFTEQDLGYTWECMTCQYPIKIEEPGDPVLEKAMAFQVSPWEELIIDYSKWQGEVNYDVLQPQQLGYHIIKAGQSNWTDSQYERNVQQLTGRNMQFGIYHYFDPRYNIVTAANYLADQFVRFRDLWMKPLPYFGPYTGVLTYLAKYRVWLDVESNLSQNGTYSATQLASLVSQFINVFEYRTGFKMGIYTRASFWDYCIARGYINVTGVPLWVAHYNTTISSPKIPLDWSNLGQQADLWQYDAKGPGKEMGMQSYGLDMNRLNTSISSMDNYGWDRDTVPPPAFEPYQVVINTAVGKNLNMRYEPTDIKGSASVIGIALRGKDFWVLGEATDTSGRKWLDLGKNVWVAEWLTKPK